MKTQTIGDLTPPLKWHGGKHYLATKIIALMPPHTHYVEPYAGGLSVMLAKDPEGISEVANDLNGSLINFWLILRCPERFPAFCRQVEATPFSENHWEAAREILSIYERNKGLSGPFATDEELTRWAVTFFMCCRQSLAGRMKAFAPLSKTRTRRGMNEQASAWLNAVEGLPAVHARLKRVAILNRDAIDVIAQQDGPATLFYCDPPYLHSTRASTGEYAHEMTHEQHERLLIALRGTKGRFLLSGYRSELYDDCAAANGWARHDFDLPNNSAGGTSKRRMTECVWCNLGK